MRQKLRSHPTYANVMATLAVFIALGGTSAAAVIITSNSQVAQNTISGHKSPSGKHPNLIAGSVNGQDVADNTLGGADINEATLTGDVRRLDWSASPFGSPPPTTIATVGPYVIKGHCTSQAGEVKTRLLVNGPASTADVMYSRTQNDVTDLGTSSSGLLTSANADTEVVGFTSGPGSPFPGNYRRAAGTVMLRSRSTLVQVDFNAVADFRSNFPETCFIYGTATRAT